MDLGSAGVSRFADRDLAERSLWICGAGCAACMTIFFIFFEYQQSELRSVRGGGPVVGRGVSPYRQVYRKSTVIRNLIPITRSKNAQRTAVTGSKHYTAAYSTSVGMRDAGGRGCVELDWRLGSGLVHLPSVRAGMARSWVGSWKLT